MNLENVEDLLEHLFMNEEEGMRYQVEKVADGIAAEAEAKGYLTRAGKAMKLTPAGLDLAKKVVRRHRLAECLLHDVLVSGDQYDKDACSMEHLLNANLEERVCVLLGHPRECPHGRPIPEGECCRLAREAMVKEVVALCDLCPGQEGVVAYLKAESEGDMRKFLAMGLLPGTRLRLEQRFPAYVFALGHSRFVIDRELAQAVQVHLTQA